MSRKAVTMTGFGVPDTRLTWVDRDTTLLSFTEANPRPGSAVSSSATAALLPAIFGGQDAGIDVRVQKSGMPGIGLGAVRVLHRPDGATYWRGHHGPGLPVSWSMLVDNDEWAMFDATRIEATGKAVVVTSQEATTGAAECHIWSPATRAWVTTTIDANAGAVLMRSVAVAAIPGNRLVALIQSGAYAADSVDAYTSSDEGSTWALQSEDVFGSATSGSDAIGGDRMSMVWTGVDLLCLVWSYDTGANAVSIDQYASSDYGATFVLVRTWNAAGAAVPSSINLFVLPGGRIGMMYLGTGTFAFGRVVGSAWEPFEDAEEVSVNLTASRALAAHVDEDGTLYYAETGTATGITIIRSLSEIGDIVDVTVDSWALPVGSATDYINNMIMSSASGRSFLIHTAVADSGGNSTVIQAEEMGGWTEWELTTSSPVLCTSVTELPFNLGAQWSQVGGFGTWARSDDFTQLTGSAVGIDYVQHDFSGLLDIVWMGEVFQSSGGDVASGISQILILSGDGTGGGGTAYSTALRLDAADAVRWVDIGSGTVTLATITHDWSVDGYLALMMAIDASTGTGHLWYRVAGSETWTRAAAPAALNDTLNGETSRVAFGAMAVGAHVVRYRAGFIDDAPAGTLLDLDTDMLGKRIGAYPYPVPEIGPDTQIGRLAALSGPGFLAETYDVDPVADRPLSSLYYDVSPSPWRSVWRASGEAEAIVAAWDLTVETERRSMVLVVINTNVPSLVLEGWTGAAWATIYTLSMVVGTGFSGMDYDLVGDTLYAAAAGATSGQRPIWEDELTGGWVILAGGERRKIRANTGGPMSVGATATTPKARIFLADCDGTETASGACTLYHHSAVAVVHAVAATATKLRVRIPTASTVDGYFTAGTIAVLDLAVAGQRHGRGWQHRRSRNATSRTDQGGTSYVRRMGRAPRSETVSWQDGIDLTALRAQTTDYLAADSGSPLVAVGDVPFFIEGLLERIKSGELPVLALPAIPDTSTTITDPTLYLWGRIMSDVQISHVLGEAGEDELYRVSSVTIEELV